MRSVTVLFQRSGLAAFAASVGFLALSSGAARGQESFLRGDVNTDGQISISDSLMLRRWLFNGDVSPSCLDSADFNDDGHVDLTDQVMVLRFAFIDGSQPAAPFPDAGTDPTDGETGSPFPVDCAQYEVLLPQPTEDMLRVEDLEAPPGARVAIPIRVTSSIEYEAFQVVLSYDPEILTPASTGAVPFPEFIAGGYFEDSDLERFMGFLSQKAFPAQGILVVAFVPNLIETGFELPPGEAQVLFNVVGTISPEAPVGTVVHLDPLDAGFGPASVRTEFTHRGQASFISSRPRAVGGILQIVGDQTFFVRGDSNNDTEVDLSDAQFTLSYLFLGSAAPRCRDAADANDDGRLDVADPIAVLQFLFMGQGTIRPPYPLLGLDPSADLLGCSGPAAG